MATDFTSQITAWYQAVQFRNPPAADLATYNASLQANAANPAQGLTAAQLGLLLDLFANEIYRFDVAKFCAPRVVNPMHALGLSGKFNNSIYQRDYVDLMSKQR